MLNGNARSRGRESKTTEVEKKKINPEVLQEQLEKT
jgi:hypothetical protein